MAALQKIFTFFIYSLFVLLLWGAASCGCATSLYSSYTTRDNWNVRVATFHDVFQEDVEATFDYFKEEYLLEYDVQIEDEIDNIDLWFFNFDTGVSKKLGSWQESGLMKIWLENNCVIGSSLLHEIMHAVQNRIQLDPDYHHEDKRDWDFVNRIRNKARNEICP